MEALDLARIQFALNITVHFLFPSITIALGWVLLGLKFAYARTGAQTWMHIYALFAKIFALSFAFGVVTGIVMSFQFGTNWPGFMETVGNVAGPLLAYEVLTAFFLEAVFIGIMLFGPGRVPDWLHTLATFLVALGTSLSAFWILVLNSWMHTPAGFEMRDGMAFVTSWAEVIFNPSMPYRISHTLLSSGLTVAFFMAGLAALRWVRGQQGQDVRRTLQLGVGLGAVLIPIQIFVGDLHGLNTLEHQPHKIAMMEGVLETQEAAPFVLFAYPVTAEDRFEVSIPGASSFILTHHRSGPKSQVLGLNEFLESGQTFEDFPVTKVFWAFRLMVGAGVLMLLVSWLAVWQMWRGGQGLPRTWMIHVLAAIPAIGWVATLAGWYTTEIGRQPWLVAGVLKTSDAVGTTPLSALIFTLIGYGIVYALMLIFYIWVIIRLIRSRPEQPLFQPKPGALVPGAAHGVAQRASAGA